MKNHISKITIFPLINAGGAYQIWKLSGAALTRGRRLLEGGAYFKVREMDNIKCQNLFIFSFKIRMKQIFTINKPNVIININNIFIVLLFVFLFHIHFGVATSRIW